MMNAGEAIQDALTVQRCTDLLRMSAAGVGPAQDEIDRIRSKGFDLWLESHRRT